MKSNCITSQQWLAMSRDAGTLSRISVDPYVVAYRIIADHFSSIDVVNWENAVLGLHIVYGWMPTIPDLSQIMFWDSSKKQRVCDILSAVASGANPSISEADALKSFSNNSIVGASKLMHFLCPREQPIWDSRVAKAFYNREIVHNYLVNNTANWDLYRRTMKSWALNAEVKERCEGIRALTPYLKDISDIRAIELILFHTQVGDTPFV